MTGLKHQPDRTLPAERRHLILELLNDQGSVSVVDIEQRFGVSPMTARRDLALLVEAGHARRTHGGAMLLALAAQENAFNSRVGQNVEEKLRLAKAVVASLKANETVFVDSSSSAYYVVREILATEIRLTILTNSVAVMAVVAADAQNVELIGLGGSFRKLTRSYVGAETARAIQQYYADRLVFSVKGIELDGKLTDPDPLEAEVKRLMVSRSRNVVLVAGPLKFDDHGLNIIVPASEVDIAYLVDPPAAGVRALEAAGVEVNRV
jgi:DeoR/GlpR family transcriptional regulator of sugar metabolism